MKLQPGTVSKLESSIQKSYPHQASTFQIRPPLLFSLLKKSALSVGRAVTAPRLQKSVAPAWAGTTMSGDNGGRREVQDRRGGSHWGMSSASGSLEKSRRSLPGGRWARPPPLKGPRRAGGPLPPGPSVGRAAREEPPGAAAGRGAGPCPRPPRFGSISTWGSQGHRLRAPRPSTSSSARPADPPATRLGPPAASPGAPHGHRLWKEQPWL